MDVETICRRSEEQTSPLLLRGGRGSFSYKNQSYLILSFFDCGYEKILGAINSTLVSKRKKTKCIILFLLNNIILTFDIIHCTISNIT